MFDLSTPIEELYLVGPARAKLLKKLGINTLSDLIFYFPRAHQDLSKFTDIKDLKLGETANIKAKILDVKTFRTKVRRFTLTHALVEDDTGSILCVWFNQPFLTKVLQKNESFIFSGKVSVTKNKLQLQNPVYEQERAEQVHTSRLVPLYPLTANLTQKQLRSIIKTYLNKIMVPEYLPADIIRAEKLLDENAAIKTFHFPEDQIGLQRAQNRLAFDEIFQTQLRVLQYKKTREQKHGLIINPAIDLAQKIQKLPFELTNGQKQALHEIVSDFRKPFPANRLLEGDVGSGKTIIATLAMWLIAKSGFQAVLLAPTEILAKQHYANLIEFFKPEDIHVSLHTSSHKSEPGQIAVGTHALLEKGMFSAEGGSASGGKNLALVVIDEQHRFGVEQRSILKQVSTAHLLTMSATPIPRTLALTLYGDLDLSRLNESPAGRPKTITKIVAEENRTKAYEFIAKQITAGHQVFVICPLIEETDKLGVKSATAEYKKLAHEIFPQFEVGLLHGKLKSSEKEAVMEAFSAKGGSASGGKDHIDILVSTSVVEVGVDVPNATIMMIEGAERFGLAQLHQFRGRVGRSEHKSYCLLFSDDPEILNNPRLQALVANNNGFELAEKDLQIRGSGDLYGTKQSGYDFKIANLSNLDLVERSRGYAEKLLNQDINLSSYPLLKEKLANQPLVHLE